jgi:hypothetical protein
MAGWAGSPGAMWDVGGGGARARALASAMTKTQAPLCRLKWRCSAIWISIPHLRRPMQCKASAIRGSIQPRVHQSKALGELSP